MNKLKKDERTVEFTLVNNTSLPINVDLFDLSLNTIPTIYSPTSFYISGTTDYNFFVRNLEYEPMDIKHIGIYSKTQEQLYNPIAIQKKDSNGISSINSDFPILNVSQWQKQGNRSEIDTDGLIFDGRTFFSKYKINSNESVVLKIRYNQFNRYCFAEFPSLFPNRKNITKEITSDIIDVVCKRESEFKSQDKDYECKIGKDIFQLTMKNNTNQQQFVNLFDSFNLQQITNSPSNTITTYLSSNYSKTSFRERLSNGNVYTFGGSLHRSIVAYSSDGSGFITEYTHPNNILYWEFDNVNEKIYFVDSSTLLTFYVYDLGTGNTPTQYVMTALPSQPTSLGVDNINGFVYVGVKNGNIYYSWDMITFSVQTHNLIPVISLNNDSIGYYSSIDRIICQDDISKQIYYLIPNGTNLIPILNNGLDISEAPIDLPDIGLMALIFENKIVFIDNSGVLGTIQGAVGSFFVYVSYDSERQQIITTESGTNNRVLIMTLDSISNDTFIEEIPLSITPQYNGFMSNGLLFMGKRTGQPISILNRKSDIEFTNTDSYNFLTQSLGDEPIKVSCVDIISNSQSQLTNNLVVQNKDANGYISSFPKNPIVDIDVEQEQGNRSLVKFDNLILDGNETFTSYPINAGEEVTMVYYYHQFKRASILSDNNVKRVKIKIPRPIIDYAKLDRIANKEKYECERVCKQIEITVTNTTTTDSLFNFFQANQTQIIINQPNATFDNVDEYNFLIQQLRESPLVLCGIEVVCGNQDQLTEPIIVNTKDSNGDRFSYQHFPINFVDTNQKNSDRVFIKTNHLILDGYTTFPIYRIKANSKITFILFYRQYLKSDFLNKHIFTIIKKPIISRHSEVGEDIEYYNDISNFADNKWGFDGNVKKENKKNTDNSEKSIIFDTEQVYSDKSDNNKYSYLSNFIDKMITKYAQKRAVCNIPKPSKQNFNVNLTDLSFGKNVDVKDISQQGYMKIDKSNIKYVGGRGFIDSSINNNGCYGSRGWTFKDTIAYYNKINGVCYIVWKKS